MKKRKINMPNDFISRRTGLDRRWIPSPDHQPERRRGKDRRAAQARRFTDSFDTVAEDVPQEAIHADTPAGTTPSAPELPDGDANWPHSRIPSVTDPETIIGG